MTSLDWRLNNLLADCTTVTQVAVVATDGILRGSAGSLTDAEDKDDLLQLAAIASATASLGNSLGKLFNRDPRSAFYELSDGYVMIIAAGHNSYLIAAADGVTVDLGDLAFEAHSIIGKLGEALSVHARDDHAVLTPDPAPDSGR